MPSARSALLACCALVLIAGCGSSSDTAGTTTGSSSATTGTTAKTSSAGSTAASPKLDTTPKFAKPSASAPVQSGVVQIAYRDITIQPDSVRVKVGSRVRWTNYDAAQANVTSVSGPQRIASKNFGEGASFEVLLHTPGVIHYVCTLYPTTMNGTIEVVS
jgi:plastocyanin